MNYYVYIYLNPLKKGSYSYGKLSLDYEPFYIGKGIRARSTVHLKEAKDIKKSNKCPEAYDGINWNKVNTINEILDNNKKPIIVKLYKNITNESALRLEKSLIKLIGRFDKQQGPLFNMTDGGENIGAWWKGRKRKPFTEEHRQKLRERKLGTHRSDATKEKISKNNGRWNKGMKMSADFCEKNRIVHTGKRYSDEVNKRKGRSGDLSNNVNVYKISIGNEIVYAIGKKKIKEYFDSLGLHEDTYKKKRLQVKYNILIEPCGKYYYEKEKFKNICFWNNIKEIKND